MQPWSPALDRLRNRPRRPDGGSYLVGVQHAPSAPSRTQRRTRGWRTPLVAALLLAALAVQACGDSNDVVLTDVSELVKDTRDGVVTVSQTQYQVRVQDLLETRLVPFGVGTGIVIDDAGRILTNFHVIEGASAVVVTSRDGQQRPARILGEAPEFDLALLQVEDPEGLRPLPLGSSRDLEVGDPVIAIGNALGLDATSPTVSVGIVSATDRTITTEDGGVLQGLLQTDAAINPGNSGGPLLDGRGRVIGINTAIAGNAQSVGFAIAIDGARELIERFLEGSPRPDVGLQLIDNTPQRAAQLRLGVDSGAIVASLSPGPSGDAGLRPGDVIVMGGGRQIASASDFTTLVAEHVPGDVLVVVLVRQGTRFTLTITVGERPIRFEAGP